MNDVKVGSTSRWLVIAMVGGLGCGTEGLTDTNEETSELRGSAVRTSMNFGPDDDDLMIRRGDERWTMDADTGTALYVRKWKRPQPISIRDFLLVWYDLQELKTQDATQLITYSCFGRGWTTWPTPHKYEVRKVEYHDGVVIDFLDPNGDGASYVFQGQNGPTDLTPDHAQIRRMQGGFSKGDGFRATWTHLMDRSMGCVGSPKVCRQGSADNDLVLLLGGYTGKKTFNKTNCGEGDPARTISSIRFFVEPLKSSR